MKTGSEKEEGSSPLCSFVPMSEYNLPAEPVSLTVKKGINIFRRIFHRAEEETVSPLKKGDELRKMSDWMLDRIAPEPDWDEAAAALDETLDNLFGQSKSDSRVVLLVSPPYSGYREILSAWAEQYSSSMVSPPSPEQILEGEVAWLKDLGGSSGAWVFPELERAYLRHANGLDLVRNFLSQASAGNFGHGMIGCNSWAWAFLRHVWQGRPPFTLTLQAFDEGRLAECFRRLASDVSRQQLLFRASDSGNHVLPPPEGVEVSGQASSYLKLLAAYSRGVHGVARAIWRSCLQTEPDDEITEEMMQEDPKLPHQTVWVTPWDERKHLSLGANTGHDKAFVLHALLLHQGLPFDLLQKVLPISPNRLMETLSLLEKNGIVIQQEGVWSVTALGYIPVRQFLQEQGYLVDDF